MFGDATCKLPEDEDECRQFLQCLQTPVEHHDELVRHHCVEGEDLRYRHFHHHRADRAFSATGLPTVQTGETNFRDDRRRDRLVSPQPKRPRTGALGVEESPSKKREWDAELVSMSGHERRWDGLVRDSTETKLSIQYSTADGIYYEPSGCLQTAIGLLHVPWPLPARRIDFPRAVSVADSRAIAADSDCSSSEEDGPPQDSDEQQEDAEQSPEQQVASVTRRSARVAAAR